MIKNPRKDQEYAEIYMYEGVFGRVLYFANKNGSVEYLDLNVDNIDGGFLKSPFLIREDLVNIAKEKNSKLVFVEEIKD
jgi:hypothetical protein